MGLKLYFSSFFALGCWSPIESNVGLKRFGDAVGGLARCSPMKARAAISRNNWILEAMVEKIRRQA